MKPILFTIGSYSFHSWSLMFFLAAAVVIFLAIKEIPWHEVEERFLDKIYQYAWEAFTLGLALAIIGSRLMFVLTHQELFQGGPWWKVIAFWEGGMVYYGGFYAVIAGSALYCYYREIPFWETLDYLIPYIALGYAIARVGCFLNGCCYGQVTGAPWGMIFPTVDNLPRHPTQLYSSFSSLLIFFFLRNLRKQRLYDGHVFTWFIILYGIYRFTVEFFRVNKPFLSFMTLSQLTALVFIVAGILALIWQKLKIAKKDKLS